MPKSTSFNVTYDAGSDVLYLSVRREAAARADEDQRGIVWRYGSGGELIGATIMDFGELWSETPEVLAQELAARFEMPLAQTTVLVERVLDGIHH